MPSQDQTNEMHAKILSIVSVSGRQCDSERVVNNVWIINVKQGPLIVNILHPLNRNYILVRFRFDLNETDKKFLISGLHNTTVLSEFEFGLRSAITSNDISYFLRREKCAKNLDIPVGFDIISKVFPLKEEFDIDQIDKAIQNVINFGILGISFFRTKVISSKRLIEMLQSMSTSPSGMYG